MGRKETRIVKDNRLKNVSTDSVTKVTMKYPENEGNHRRHVGR